MSDGRRVAVVLVGVGGAPAELLRTAEQILGPLEDVTALGFAPDAARQDVDARVRRAATKAGRGTGVLLITDLCGSTLANVCYAAASEEEGYDVLCGMSLAMLMKLLSTDREALDATALARSLADTGRRGIRLFSDTAESGAGGCDE